MRVAVVTVSSSAAAGDAADTSGPRLAELIVNSGLAGSEEVILRINSDERASLASLLRSLASDGVRLILTTGGTGFSTDDVTPEATLDVIEREAPGLSEAIRADAATRITTGILSRGVAGIIGSSLIVNLPGSPRGVEESFAVLAPVLPHALAQLEGPGGRERH